MANYAYLRVSTKEQDVHVQKFGVLEYCHNQGLMPINFVEDVVSGMVPWRKRKIAEIVDKLEPCDNLIVSEISRLGRTQLQVFEIIDIAVKRKVLIHVIKSNLITDETFNTKMTVSFVGLMSEFEREFISTRTKEALRKAKANGKKLGRPFGQQKSLTLDPQYNQIIELLNKGISIPTAARLLNVSKSSMYDWVQRRLRIDFEKTKRYESKKVFLNAINDTKTQK